LDQSSEADEVYRYCWRVSDETGQSRKTRSAKYASMLYVIGKHELENDDAIINSKIRVIDISLDSLWYRLMMWSYFTRLLQVLANLICKHFSPQSSSPRPA
jgi:hypothetical protein